LPVCKISLYYVVRINWLEPRVLLFIVPVIQSDLGM